MSSRSRAVLLAAAILACALGPTAAASAQGSTAARCRRLQAQAESQAFLLVSPTLWAEAVHVPRVGDDTGTGLYQGGPWQLRAALSYSVLDLVRGVMVLGSVDAECRQHLAVEHARRTLELGEAIGELPARRAEREVLVGAREEVDGIVATAERRLREGLSTQMELGQIQAEALRLQRRADQLAGEIERLRAAGHEEADPAALRADLSDYERATIELERQRSSIRRLSAWTVSVRGGVVPIEPVDWFGQVQVGFNLGGFAQQIAEDAVVSAREGELRELSTELRSQIDRLEQRLRDSVPVLRTELGHVERQIELVERQRTLLGELETAEVAHVRAMLELQELGLRAEQARLAALVMVRAAIGGEHVERP